MLLNMRPLNFERRPVKIYERTGPGIKCTHPSFQFIGSVCEIEFAFFFFQHRRIGRECIILYL